MAETRNARRHLQGTVSSTKAQNTITIEVERTFKHARYGKYLRRRKKYMVHDAEEAARTGDLVEIAATRPLSKRKRWRLVRVINRSDLDTGPVPGGVEIADAAGGDG